jgi:6-phosphofructokinase
VATFGFETAVAFATDCLDRLHTTAESHHRVIVVEMMGRYAGWIALESGISGSADVILIPEIPFDLQKVAAKIDEREKCGSKFAIVVVAEGAKPVGGQLTYQNHLAG